MNVGNELTEYNVSLPVLSETDDNEYKREEIRIYKKNSDRTTNKYFKY